jgi:hypothetical protein
MGNMASFFDKPIKSPKSPKIAKFQKVPRGNEILETFQNSVIFDTFDTFLLPSSIMTVGG